MVSTTPLSPDLIPMNLPLNQEESIITDTTDSNINKSKEATEL